MDLVIQNYDLIKEEDLRENPLFFEFFENFSSEHTKKSYRNDINQFFDFLRDYLQSVKSLKDIKRLHSVAYRKWLTDSDYAPKTINRKMSSVSSFFDFLIEKNFVEYNIFQSVKRPKQVVQKATNDLTDEQIVSLFEIIEKNKSESRHLHKAIIAMLFTTGIRKSELIYLKRKDFFKEQDFWMIRVRAKGGKILTKVVPDYCYHAVQDYLSWMVSIKREVEREDWLFQPTRNPKNKGHLVKPLDPKTINYIVKNYCKKAGVPQNVSTHSARASYIGSALENGADLYKVSRDVGHSSVKTTEEYDKRRRKVQDSPIHHLGFLKKSS